MPAELERRLSNKQRALRLLQDRGTVTNVELVAVAGLRALARVHELQKQYDIQVKQIKGGLWSVTYQGPRTPKQLQLV